MYLEIAELMVKRNVYFSHCSMSFSMEVGNSQSFYWQLNHDMSLSTIFVTKNKRPLPPNFSRALKRRSLNVKIASKIHTQTHLFYKR